MPQPRFFALLLVLAPAGITGWFVMDGGLSNGLNRLVYECTLGTFLAGYALVLALLQHMRRHQKHHSLLLGRLAWASGAAAVLWVIAAVTYENRG